jgi:hypothetical protein
MGCDEQPIDVLPETWSDEPMHTLASECPCKPDQLGRYRCHHPLARDWTEVRASHGLSPSGK